MATRDMSSWETRIAKVVSTAEEEEVVVRGERLSDLVGRLSFAEMTFLLLQGRRPGPEQARVLDALLVASMEHGIAPPSMISRCFASYGTSIQTAVGAGILAFGDRMGGLGEQLAMRLCEHVPPPGSADDAILRGAARARRSPPPGSADDAILRGAAAAIVEREPRVPGFGIPLHRADPRVPMVLAVARREGVAGPYCRLGTLIEELLAARRGGRPVPMNLDGVSAVVGLDLGFDWRTIRLLLLTPRSVSIGAHYLEELAQETAWRHIPADGIAYED